MLNMTGQADYGLIPHNVKNDFEDVCRLLQKVRGGRGPQAAELVNKSEFFLTLFRAADRFLAAESTTITDGEESPKVIFGREALDILFEEARAAFKANRGDAKLLNDFSTFSWLVTAEMQEQIDVWQESGAAGEYEK